MPTRTCIGCRRKEEQESFLRVARNRDGILGLWDGIGRSAYVHRDANCREQALQKGRLERALKGAVSSEERAALRKVFEWQLR